MAALNDRNYMVTRVVTDTATIVIYDLGRLKHRLDDPCDWWSVPKNEVLEINQGNALFVATGYDCGFDIEIVTSDPLPDTLVVRALIKNDSGCFFIGAGEYVSGDGFEPKAEHGNVFVDYPAGVYRVSSWMDGPVKVCVQFAKVARFAPNSFTDSPRIG